MLRSSLSLVSFALVVLATSGCQSTPPAAAGTYAVTSCSADGECAAGQVCERALCLVTCAADWDCPSGAVCTSGACFAGRFGACTSDSDCRSGEACIDSACAELPDHRTCTADSDCPPMTVCTAAGVCEFVSTCTAVAEICGNGIDDDCDGIVDDGCSAVCMGDADCGAGQACVHGVCTPIATTCMSDEECGAGQACLHGVCAPIATTCMSDAECGGAGFGCISGICQALPVEICGNHIDDDGDGLVDEDCGGVCSVDSDCAAGQVCASGICTAACTPVAEICVNGADDDCDGIVDDGCPSGGCRTDAECSAGQVCYSGTCVAG